MKSSVESLSATRVKLTVEVPFDELKPEFDNAFKNLAQQVSLPGFRKGKVPATVGTLPTHRPLFAGLLAAVTVLVTALTFFPVLALGPLAEGLM